MEQLDRNSHRIRVSLNGEREQWILLRGDVHHDNPSCDQALEEKHLKQAKERNAAIICNGDAFCAMQGKYDLRSNKSAVRPEHQCDDYLDSLVKTYADFLAPYAHQFALIGTGNHETGILKRHETNLTTRLVERLNTMTGSNIYAGSYTGWLKVSLKRGTPEKRQSVVTTNIWRTHGYGGGSAVTRGVPETSRRAVYLPDADVVLSSHIHHEWTMPIQRMRITTDGKVYQDEQMHIQLPTYKDSYKDGHSFGNWEVERGMAPRTKGAVWMVAKIKRHPVERVVCRYERAQ